MKISKPFIIADSSGLYSLAHSIDSNHQKAVKISIKISENNWKMIIPSDVFSEILNVVGKKLGKEKQLDLTRDLLSGDFLIIESDEKTRLSAVEKLKKLPNSVSYTDCAVMAFADEYKTKEIFGFDEVFSKEGYKLPV